MIVILACYSFRQGVPLGWYCECRIKVPLLRNQSGHSFSLVRLPSQHLQAHRMQKLRCHFSIGAGVTAGSMETKKFRTIFVLIKTLPCLTDALFPAQPPADDKNPKRKYSYSTLRLPKTQAPNDPSSSFLR